MKLEDIVASSRPQSKDIVVEGEGILIWIHSPKEKLASLQILGMYGGVEVIATSNDSLYFFRSLQSVPFTLLYKTVVLRYNALVYILPGVFYLDKNLKKHIYYEQSITYGEDLCHIDGRLFLHLSFLHQFPQQSGVTLSNDVIMEQWHECNVHRNATVPQGLLWNVIIKAATPITGEKKSNLLWQSTLQILEEFLRNKRMHVAKHNNAFLQLIFSSQEQLRNFIFDFQNFITFHSQEVGEDSFTATTVIASLQRNTSMYSADIDTYYHFNANEVIFNHCHTTLYDALILGKDFNFIPTMQEKDFSSWVVILEKQELSKKDVRMLTPLPVALGEYRCFYCGMNNHSTQECPTHIFPWDSSLPSIWDKLGKYSFEQLVETSDGLIETFEKNMSLQEILELYNDETERGLFVRALFAIPIMTQLRTAPIMFSRRNQEQSSYKKSNKQEAQLHYFSKRIASQEVQQVEYELYELIKQNKDYRYYTFLGFTSIEKGDYDKAINYWKEGERLSYTPKLVAWHLHLQGRAYEILGQYNNALALYRRAMAFESTSKEIRYRYIVTLIQMGRIETGIRHLEKHIQSYPEDFVKILLDMQARQGYLEITRVLNRMLHEYATRVEHVEKEIENDSKDISIWTKYEPTTFQTLYNNFYEYFEQRKRKDFLTYSIILDKYTEYQENMRKHIVIAIESTMQRVERVFNKLMVVKEHLKSIPIRSQLRDFNRQLENSVAVLEKIEKSSLERAEYFEFITKKLDEMENNMGEMEQSIYFMQMVRDSSLFIVLFLRNFIIAELIVAILIVVGIPALFYYAAQSGLLLNGMPEFSLQWDLQKNTIVVATGIVLIVVGSSTLLRFKKKKKEIITQFIDSVRKTT